MVEEKTTNEIAIAIMIIIMIMRTLIDNHEIKDILMKTFFTDVDYDYHSRELAPQIATSTKEKISLAN